MRSNTIRSLALLAATAATVAAESTVTLFMPYADPQSLVGEVLGSSDSATTYLVNCAAAGEDCGMPSGGVTIVQGASTVQQTLSYTDDYYAYGCKLGGTTSLSCLISQTDSAGSTHVRAAVDTTSIASFFLPVVVTGTATAGGPATTGASITAGTASATPTGSSASASTSHSSSGNAAMPQITGNANWAIGGAAMAMALAMA